MTYSSQRLRVCFFGGHSVVSMDAKTPRGYKVQILGGTATVRWSLEI